MIKKLLITGGFIVAGVMWLALLVSVLTKIVVFVITGGYL